MTIKALIFDLGGVLVRTEHPQVRHRLEKRLGFAPGTLDRAIWGGEDWELALTGRISYDEYWKRVGTALRLSTEQEMASFRSEYFSGDRVDDELVDLIRELGFRYRIGLLSNAPDKLDTWLEEQWGIADAFDAIVYSAKAGVAKPDRRIFDIILGQLDVAAREALFVDDYPPNIDAARSLGMQAIRFTDTGALKDELRRHIGWDTEYSAV